MKLVIAGALLIAARAAAADPIEPLGALPDGNLRVDLRCADYWATPHRGLTITVDGAPADSTGTNGATVIRYGKHGAYTTWQATDIGFSLPPGEHRIEADAPGCAGEPLDVTITPARPTYVSGRLAVRDPELRGTTSAPDGLGFAFGPLTSQLRARSGVATLGEASTAYTSGAAQERGIRASLTYERRRLAWAFDVGFAWGDTSGAMHEVAEPYPAVVMQGAMPYHDAVLDLSGAMRLGMRVPMHDFALAAGGGVGATIRTHAVSATGASDPFAVSPPGTEGGVFVPIWAAVTWKPACNFGGQVLASYDVFPGTSSYNGVTLAAALVFQPNAACAASPGIRVH